MNVIQTYTILALNTTQTPRHMPCWFSVGTNKSLLKTTSPALGAKERQSFSLLTLFFYPYSSQAHSLSWSFPSNNQSHLAAQRQAAELTPVVKFQMEAGHSGPISQHAPCLVLEVTKLAPELATPQARTFRGKLAPEIVQKQELATSKSVQLVSNLNLRLSLVTPNCNACC